MIMKEVTIVKELISCNISPVAMFFFGSSRSTHALHSFRVYTGQG